MGQSSTKSGVVVWGSPEYGQLGIGGLPTEDKAWPPRLVEGLRSLPIKHVSCGGHHSAVVTEGGEVYTWGRGRHGQLGHGELKDVVAPKSVRQLQSKVIKQVSCADHHSAAVSESGVVYTWGLGQNGRLGHGSEISENLPKPVESLSGQFIVEVSCGSFHTACLTVNPSTVYTWGLGLSGRLGHGNEVDRLVPCAVKALEGLSVVRISCGGHHTAAVTETNELYTWGGGAFGKLGHNSRTGQHSPQQVLGALKNRQVTSVSLGAQHSAAVTNRGELFTWGQAGRLGHAHHGAEADEMSPRQVTALSGLFVLQVSCGHSHTAAVTETGDVWAWGTSRVLGHVDPQTAPNTPTCLRMLIGKAIVQVCCGQSHTIVLSDFRKLSNKVTFATKALQHINSNPPPHTSTTTILTSSSSPQSQPFTAGLSKPQLLDHQLAITSEGNLLPPSTYTSRMISDGRGNSGSSVSSTCSTFRSSSGNSPPGGVVDGLSVCTSSGGEQPLVNEGMKYHPEGLYASSVSTALATGNDGGSCGVGGYGHSEDEGEKRREGEGEREREREGVEGNLSGGGGEEGWRHWVREDSDEAEGGRQPRGGVVNDLEQIMCLTGKESTAELTRKIAMLSVELKVYQEQSFILSNALQDTAHQLALSHRHSSFLQSELNVMRKCSTDAGERLDVLREHYMEILFEAEQRYAEKEAKWKAMFLHFCPQLPVPPGGDYPFEEVPLSSTAANGNVENNGSTSFSTNSSLQYYSSNCWKPQFTVVSLSSPFGLNDNAVTTMPTLNSNSMSTFASFPTPTATIGFGTSTIASPHPTTASTNTSNLTGRLPANLFTTSLSPAEAGEEPVGASGTSTSSLSSSSSSSGGPVHLNSFYNNSNNIFPTFSSSSGSSFNTTGNNSSDATTMMPPTSIESASVDSPSAATSLNLPVLPSASAFPDNFMSVALTKSVINETAEDAAVLTRGGSPCYSSGGGYSTSIASNGGGTTITPATVSNNNSNNHSNSSNVNSTLKNIPIIVLDAGVPFTSTPSSFASSSSTASLSSFPSS